MSVNYANAEPPEKPFPLPAKIAIAAVICALLFYFFVYDKSNTSSRPINVTDCGYKDKPRGWYDVKNSGYRNDYCRYVGTTPVWWSCSVHGELGSDGKPVVYSPNGKYAYDANASFDPFDEKQTTCS